MQHLPQQMKDFKICEQIMPRFFVAMQKQVFKQIYVQDRTLYTVCLQSKSELSMYPELSEALQNEIFLLRSSKHQGLMELLAVYEDAKFIYQVFEFFKGESLYSLIESGLILDEVQMASMIYQLLQLLKYLKKVTYHHGNISPLTTIINTNHSMLQVVLIYSAYKEYSEDDGTEWLGFRNVNAFIAPEVRNGHPPTIKSDMYSVGALVYYMSFHMPSKLQVLKNTQQCGKHSEETQHFMKHMKSFKIDLEKIKDAQKTFQSNGDPEGMIFSVSQLDLMLRLLSENPDDRMPVEESLKHHWFINIKSKLKQNKLDRKKKKALPSLRTIIELREQSEMDIRTQTLVHANGEKRMSQFSQLSIGRKSIARPSININHSPLLNDQTNQFDEEVIDEENAEVFSLMQSLQQDNDEKRPSKASHDKFAMFRTFKTQIHEDMEEKKEKIFVKCYTVATPRTASQDQD